MTKRSLILKPGWPPTLDLPAFFLLAPSPRRAVQLLTYDRREV